MLNKTDEAEEQRSPNDSDHVAVAGKGDGMDRDVWPAPPAEFRDPLTEVEAAMFLRLHQTGRHTPRSAIRTLNYFRDRGWLKATPYARAVWYTIAELEKFLVVKTEQ